MVGGGLAGLAAACYLARRGYSVSLLEKAKSVGGRALTDTPHGFALNRGVHALYIRWPRLRGLARARCRLHQRHGEAHLHPIHYVDGGWQTLVDGMRRFLPRITAAGVLPLASQNGLRGRPTYQLGDVDNVYFAGDWIGPRGFLVDASLDSAREAARRILRTDPRRADQPSPEAVAAA